MGDLSFNVFYVPLLISFGIGIVLQLIFQGIKHLIRRFRINQIYGLKIERLLPLVEGIVLACFLIWSIQFVFQGQKVGVYAVIAVTIMVLLWFSWYAIRDFIAGVLLKYQDAFRIDGEVRIKEIQGRVKKLGYLSLELETFQGDILNIPYSSIFNQVRTKPHREEKVKSHTFYIEFSKTAPAADMLEIIRVNVLNAPWSAVIKGPQIKIVEEKEATYVFEVLVFSLQAQHFQKIKNYLRERMNKESNPDHLLSL